MMNQMIRFGNQIEEMVVKSDVLDWRDNIQSDGCDAELHWRHADSVTN